MFDLRDVAALAGVALVAFSLYLIWFPLPFLFLGVLLIVLALRSPEPAPRTNAEGIEALVTTRGER